MFKRVGFALAGLLIMSGAMVAEGGDRVIEVKRARPQVPLLGEVKEQRIPRSFFYEKTSPIINEERLLTAGYLSPTDNPFGVILDGFVDGKTISQGDEVIISRGSSSGVKEGDEFFVYRRLKKVVNPQTETDYGYIISIMGSLRVTSSKSGVATARVTSSHRMLLKGDLIAPKFDVRAPTMDPDRPLLDKSISGTIMSVGDERTTVAQSDIVYLNIGRLSNVSEGDVFAIYRKQGAEMTADRKRFKNSVGKVKIILVTESTSTGIITNSTDQINAGDRVSYLQEH